MSGIRVLGERAATTSQENNGKRALIEIGAVPFKLEQQEAR